MGNRQQLFNERFRIYLTSMCHLAKGRFLENGYKKTLHLKKLIFFLDAM
ncbi:hypothetical protein HMPREF9087_0847 [Enterococcus casseliflavus ATCC 12755]|uniref:Uncharacterized protein n=1 Tax=Enterococcus casseliflavus ATCC 12755 TaxID=888066 RepID=F0EHF5_ENTCA|nr:hypothetical protein HMPREF9087_0847 [Enterococcus casseliflavus ATCC 12755]